MLKMEVKNRLLNFKNAYIYQNDDWFKFSLDSVLLANFVTINLRTKKILDLATGNAPIPMLLTYRTKAEVYGVELQEEIYNLGQKSIVENDMLDQIHLLNIDVKNTNEYLGFEKFDVVTCNPPYFKTNNEKLLNDDNIKAIARHEIFLSLDDVCKIASNSLKNKGIFALVHRPERFLEILDTMRKYNIEPKKIQFVYPKIEKEANIVLIEGIKNGNSGLKLLNPIIVYDENNNYNISIKKMFEE